MGRQLHDSRALEQSAPGVRSLTASTLIENHGNNRYVNTGYRKR
jgi:hypothetical protein